ncbi:MAG: cobyrinate a,c-diamide synthase [Pseudomonadota bacterium]
MKAILIAAARSGSGKTTVSLGIMRALARAGTPPRTLKLGPDYIDPGYHISATGRPARNLDPWAMDDALQSQLIAGPGPLVIESAMGLFDGAGLTGAGSAAEVARRFDIPILLVVDCASTSHSIAALVQGFTRFDPALRFHGLVLNNVGSRRHAAMLRAALERVDLPPVRAVIQRDPDLARPSRHLGLVQAREQSDLAPWLDTVADALPEAQLLLGDMPDATPVTPTAHIPPLGQRIAVAQDHAFAFFYPHLGDAWHAAGAEVVTFSPLADEPAPEADAIYLPGGYPELHAGRLATADSFMAGLRRHAETRPVHGECGGYMTLGDGLTDADGTRHEMLGLLRLETSFAKRKLHLGYRHLTGHGPLAGAWRGHEFHHSTELSARGTPLFSDVRDADGAQLPDMGLRNGRVMGSYAHLIALDPTGQSA